MSTTTTSTPTTVIGGRVIVGLQEADDLRLAVEGVAAETGQTV